jgi:hypothetical protein
LRVVLRKDLDELVSHHRSQMPEGLEANCSLQQMADLIAFLARTVPVDGRRDSVPERPGRAPPPSP